jgi:uronate dehydrogenase
MARILLTGAAGDIGTRLRKLLKPIYPNLRLSDIRRPADLGTDEEFASADLARLDEVEKIAEGIDGIIHLGGHSVEGPWETILRANIIATICSRQRAARASSAWCSPPPIMQWASIRATIASART